jgi:DNA-binding MarR family transcriptional regulator
MSTMLTFTKASIHMKDLSARHLIEPLFFAYRDFVGDADKILSAYGFGRAHHRVLHFVGSRPHLTIAELLFILKITKQSLNRVLKELIDQGYIQTHPGETDRRQKHLSLTQDGITFVERLTQVQVERLQEAIKKTCPDTAKSAYRFLQAVSDHHLQEDIL